MADSDKFTVTTSWTAVEANGADITNGTFTVFSRMGESIAFAISTAQPPESETGDIFFDERKDSFKFSLGASENLYARAGSDATVVGVVPA